MLRSIYLSILLFLSFNILAVNNKSQYFEMVDSATICMNNDRWEDAESWLKRALRAEPANSGNSMLLSNLCIAQIKLNKPADALMSIDAALSRMPNNFLFRRNRILALMAAGRISESIVDIDNILKIEPDNLKILLLRGSANLELAEYAEAEKDFRLIIERDTTDTAALQGMALCCEHQGKLTDANKCYTTLIEIEPTAYLYFKRAYNSAILDNYNAADEDVRLGIACDQRYGNLYALRGWLSKKRYRNTEYEADKKLAEKYGADAQMILWMSQ